MSPADWSTEQFRKCQPSHAMQCCELADAMRLLAFIWPSGTFANASEFILFTRRFESLLKFLPEECPKDLQNHFVLRPNFEESARQVQQLPAKNEDLASSLADLAPEADLQWIPAGHFDRWLMVSGWPRLELVAWGARRFISWRRLA